MSTNTSEQLQPVTTTAAALPKYIIQANLKGFPVSVEAQGKADVLLAIVDRLIQIGATPPAASAATSAPSASDATDTCPTHGAKLKQSQKPGTWFCPKKNDDGSYCNFKVKR